MEMNHERIYLLKAKSEAPYVSHFFALHDPDALAALGRGAPPPAPGLPPPAPRPSITTTDNRNRVTTTAPPASISHFFALRDPAALAALGLGAVPLALGLPPPDPPSPPPTTGSPPPPPTPPASPSPESEGRSSKLAFTSSPLKPERWSLLVARRSGARNRTHDAATVSRPT